MIVLESNQNHATAKETEVCTTLPASMGLGGGYVPMIVSYGFKPRQGAKARGLGYEKELAPTLNIDAACSGGVLITHPIVFRDDITIKIDEDDTGFTLGARDFKGVQCVSYQTTTGALSPGAHPGGFNGQDAFSDMLVTENEDLHNAQTVLPHRGTGGFCGESGSLGLQRPSDSNHSGGGVIQC